MRTITPPPASAEHACPPSPAGAAHRPPHRLRAGGVSIALPFLEAMRRPALADAVKKRFIAFFSPNGVPMRNWSPDRQRDRLQALAHPDAARAARGRS